MFEVLSIEQVCETLGCKRRRVFELLANGTLERAPRFGRALRIYKASVERALAPPKPKQRRARRATSATAGAWSRADFADLLA